jgi:hypothetical protein
MTLADWFSPRMDGTLHWPQSLAIMLGITLLVGPAYYWWRYDQAPKATAAYEVRMAFGPNSTFEPTRLFNSLDQHDGLFPRRIGADVLVCGVVQVGDDRAPVALLARRTHRGRLTSEALFSPGWERHGLYRDVGPMVLELCAREAASLEA